jgi:predicted SAM-dependent methyltransferase
MKSLFRKDPNEALVKSLTKGKSILKMNLGCGTDYKSGWINIDNNSDNNIEKLDLNWDLRNPLPFKDNSIDFAFHEHFYEHLAPEEMIEITKDIMRVLRPGGVMRIAMPDLEAVVNNYLHVPLGEDPVITDFNLSFVKTRAEWINMSFRWWGHKWLYDWEELERRLKEAGCTKMYRCALRESKYAELKNLEVRNGSYLTAEVVKEEGS